MAEPISIPKGYKRLGDFPLDEDSVFTSLAAMEAYIAGGTSYAGHPVALVDVDANKVTLYNILPDKTYEPLGGVNVNDKGFFTTETALTTAHPVGQDGWFAIVGETDTFWIWDTDTNAWKDSGSNQTPLTLDSAPTEGSTNPLTSGGAFTALAGKAATSHSHSLANVTPEANKAKRLIIVDSLGNILDYTDFTYDTLLSVSNVNVSDINVGEKKILTVEKLADGTAVVSEAIAQLDKLGAPTLSTHLDEANVLWDGDEITITGHNLSGALGENSQEYRIGSDFFLCTAHSNGTTSADGWATWVRNRGQDSLTPGIAHDDLIIAELEDIAGWSTAGFKQINSKSKKGTWYRAIAGGPLFMCINKNNGWTRVEFPDTTTIEITTTSHPILTANLSAHDFVTNGMYNESLDATNEEAEQGQEYWDTANNAWYKRNKDGYWAKMT